MAEFFEVEHLGYSSVADMVEDSFDLIRRETQILADASILEFILVDGTITLRVKFTEIRK